MNGCRYVEGRANAAVEEVFKVNGRWYWSTIRRGGSWRKESMRTRAFSAPARMIGSEAGGRMERIGK